MQYQFRRDLSGWGKADSLGESLEPFDDLLTTAPTANCALPPLEVLRALFTNPDLLRPEAAQARVTEHAASEFAKLADSLEQKGIAPEHAAHFLMRLLFCLFADSIGLLPDHLFRQMIALDKSSPTNFTRKRDHLLTPRDVMRTQRNAFRDIKQNHPKCVLMHLAQVAFNSTTFRIFSKGSAKKIRKFVADKIGDGRKFKSRRDFEKEHAKLIHLFPRAIRLNANTRHRKPSFGHKAKVIDLYLKTLYIQREPLDAATAKRLGKRLHVPLDNIVLKSVWKDFSQQLETKGVAKSDLSLSKLSPRHYLAVQNTIASNAKKAGTIAILYDDRYTVGSEQNR